MVIYNEIVQHYSNIMIPEINQILIETSSKKENNCDMYQMITIQEVNLTYQNMLANNNI